MAINSRRKQSRELLGLGAKAGKMVAPLTTLPSDLDLMLSDIN